MHCGLTAAAKAVRRIATASIASGTIAVVPAFAQHGTPLRDVLMTQIGFQAEAPQVITVRSADRKLLAWRVSDSSGTEVRSGTTVPFGQSEAAGERVHTLTITPALPVGEGYTLHVADYKPRGFAVSENPFGDLAEASLSYFYLNRAGTPILADYTPGPEWARSAGHMVEEVTCFDGVDRRGLKWPGCDYTLDVAGGWYDAGDFGKYAVNGGISVWMLQNMVERLRSMETADDKHWPDGRATLPEAGNGVSDILDEARWEIEMLLALQVPPGRKLMLPVGLQQLEEDEQLVLSEVDASGLVHHKVHEKKWLGLPLLPAYATEPRYLIQPSTAGTLNMVAAAAQASRLWRGIDDAFADRCLEAAKTGYAAALRHPDIFAYDFFEGGGPYTDNDVSDEFAWAAMELFATTGDASYVSGLSETPGRRWLVRARENALGDVFWANVDQLPMATMLSATDAFTDVDRERASRLLIQAADRYLDDAARDGYGVPYPANAYAWGSSGAVASRSLALGYAYDITGDQKYRNAAVAAADYLLGRNPIDQSYVAGFGDRAVRHVHHRFWAQGADAAFPPAAPGALSGGPNAGYPASPYEKAELGPCAPQKCWADDYTAFSLNEVAINWNAALFWLASFLDSTPPR